MFSNIALAGTLLITATRALAKGHAAIRVRRR
jgi:hypothetical protein